MTTFLRRSQNYKCILKNENWETLYSENVENISRVDIGGELRVDILPKEKAVWIRGLHVVGDKPYRVFFYYQDEYCKYLLDLTSHAIDKLEKTLDYLGLKIRESSHIRFLERVKNIAIIDDNELDYILRSIDNKMIDILDIYYSECRVCIEGSVKHIFGIIKYIRNADKYVLTIDQEIRPLDREVILIDTGARSLELSKIFKKEVVKESVDRYFDHESYYKIFKNLICKNKEFRGLDLVTYSDFRRIFRCELNKNPSFLSRFLWLLGKKNRAIVEAYYHTVSVKILKLLVFSLLIFLVLNSKIIAARFPENYYGIFFRNSLAIRFVDVFNIFCGFGYYFTLIAVFILLVITVKIIPDSNICSFCDKDFAARKINNIKPMEINLYLCKAICHNTLNNINMGNYYIYIKSYHQLYKIAEYAIKKMSNELNRKYRIDINIKLKPKKIISLKYRDKIFWILYKEKRKDIISRINEKIKSEIRNCYE